MNLRTGATAPSLTRHGLLWVCPAPGAERAPDPILLREEDPPLLASAAVRVAADFDQTVLGLVDPAHVPMVHTSWWWRPRSKARRVKNKAYSPSDFGFTARALDQFASAPVYRLAGARPEVAIEFRLPGVRVERIAFAGKQIFNVTTVTPEAPDRQLIRNLLYGDLPLVGALRPLVEPLARTFLRQDAGILSKLAGEEKPHKHLFVGDPDLPSLWYFALKKELAAAQAERRPFRNPVEARTLRWRT